MVRTSGFVGVLTTPSSNDPLTVGSTTANGNGAHLTAGGIWTNGSSRTFKEGVVPIDASEVLAKVAALPIATWRYKGESKAQHIGPMAEDFHSAFGLGDSERYIGTVDADGVALAAIQGLHQMMQQKDARLILQEREISLLKEKLQAIEAKLGHSRLLPHILRTGGLVKGWCFTVLDGGGLRGFSRRNPLAADAPN